VTVAVLYCDPKGPYPALLGARHSLTFPERALDCWDESRDARKYEGPHPVVAHPPCGPWGRLRHMYRGSEHDCAPRAVEQVRKWGGVLEHPAGSKLWEHCGLPTPGECDACDLLHARANCRDAFGGYTIELDQVEWGHVARKRTWLYLVGVPREALEAPPFPGREPTHRIGSTTLGRTDGTRYRPASNLKSASAQQRRRTPSLFAKELIRLARSARK
jgi:hypothetical protein